MDEEKPLTRRDVEEMVEQIAAHVTRNLMKEFFLSLDIKTDSHEAVIALRGDLSYVRAQREATEAAKKAVKSGIWKALSIAALGLLVWSSGVLKDGAVDFARTILLLK